MMGSFLWHLRQRIYAVDGTAVGILVIHRNYAPFPGLWLSGCSIFRDPEIDKEPEEVIKVTDVTTRTESAPFHFVLDLTEEDTDEDLKTALQLYGPGWRWET